VQGILHYSLYVLAPNASASVHSIEHKSVFNDAGYIGFGYIFLLFCASKDLETGLPTARRDLWNNLKHSKFPKWIMNRNKPESMIHTAQVGLLLLDASHKLSDCRAEMIADKELRA
jgi:hypothetical protein